MAKQAKKAKKVSKVKTSIAEVITNAPEQMQQAFGQAWETGGHVKTAPDESPKPEDPQDPDDDDDDE